MLFNFIMKSFLNNLDGTDVIKIIALIVFMVIFISIESAIFVNTGGGLISAIIGLVIIVWRWIVTRNDDPYLGKANKNSGNITIKLSECCNQIGQDITGEPTWGQKVYVPILSNKIKNDNDLDSLNYYLQNAKNEGFTEVRDYFDIQEYNTYAIEDAIELFIPLSHQKFVPIRASVRCDDSDDIF